jgi:hypothetical protein
LEILKRKVLESEHYEEVELAPSGEWFKGYLNEEDEPDQEGIYFDAQD